MSWRNSEGVTQGVKAQIRSLRFLFLLIIFVFSFRSLTSCHMNAPGGEGGHSYDHMKGAGMLIVSLTNFWDFGLTKGVLDKTQFQLAVKVSFRVAREELYIKIYIFNSFYLLYSCNQSLKWSFLGVKRRLSHAQTGLLQRFHSKFPTSIPAHFTWRAPPRPCSLFPGPLIGLYTHVLSRAVD